MFEEGKTMTMMMVPVRKKGSTKSFSVMHDDRKNWILNVFY